MPAELNIEVPRQGDWLQTLTLTDLEKVPVDLTGCSFAWSARAVAGTGSILATATITVMDAIAGQIEAKWHGPDFDAFGLPTEIVRAAHDLKLIYADGVVQVPVRGLLIIFPEVTA